MFSFYIEGQYVKTEKPTIFLTLVPNIFSNFFFSCFAAEENAEEDEKTKMLKSYTWCTSTRIAMTQEIRKERKETRAIKRKRKRTKAKKKKEKTIQLTMIKKRKERWILKKEV